MSEAQSVELNNPDDFHLHLRTGSVLETVAPISARQFGYGLVMPNKPPICAADDVRDYHCEIERLTQEPPPPGSSYEERTNWRATFYPLMTIKLTSETKVEDLRLAMLDGAIAAKLYPEGATTGSKEAIKITRPEDLEPLDGIFKEMERLRMVLSIHGELPDYPDLEREIAFLPVLRYVAEKYTELRIVMEHISTGKGIKLVKELGPNVAGTITAHHLVLD